MRFVPSLREKSEYFIIEIKQTNDFVAKTRFPSAIWIGDWGSIQWSSSEQIVILNTKRQKMLSMNLKKYVVSWQRGYYWPYISPFMISNSIFPQSGIEKRNLNRTCICFWTNTSNHKFIDNRIKIIQQHSNAITAKGFK